MPRKNNGKTDYTQFHAAKYVRYLGCWTFVNPTDAAKRRDPEEYRQLLNKVIEANSSRTDSAGQWETDAALEALGEL